MVLNGFSNRLSEALRGKDCSENRQNFATYFHDVNNFPVQIHPAKFAP